jgi:hypothetical protein
VVVKIRHLVSHQEILGEFNDLRTVLPRAGDLLESVRHNRLSLRDALYFLLLEAMERRRQHRASPGAGPRISQAVEAYGP